jgi:rod shape-determining protein MreC
MLLQGFCIYLIVRYNTWHNAVASGFMNEVTGKINKQYNQVDYYFQLKKTNESLARDNERLRNQLKENFREPGYQYKDGQGFDPLRYAGAQTHLAVP